MGDKIYTDDDLVLPLLAKQGRLADHAECRVEVVLRDKDVILRVGPRDWQWDRETGKLVGKGTTLRQADADGPGPLTLDGPDPEVDISAMRLSQFRQQFGNRKPDGDEIKDLRVFYEPKGEVAMWRGEKLW